MDLTAPPSGWKVKLGRQRQVVESLSCVQLFETRWTAALQAYLSERCLCLSYPPPHTQLLPHRWEGPSLCAPSHCAARRGKIIAPEGAQPQARISTPSSRSGLGGRSPHPDTDRTCLSANLDFAEGAGAGLLPLNRNIFVRFWDREGA